MHEVWTISTANMTYTRLQNYTNMMVDEHGIQTFGVVVVYIISFIVVFLYFYIFIFFPTSAHPLLFLGKWFVHMYLANARLGPLTHTLTGSIYKLKQST